MLYDRFDDMRSKGASGGGGSSPSDYNLTRIGTAVSCIAQSNVKVGDKIVGTKNQNYAPTLIMDSLFIQINSDTKSSQNLEVLIQKTSNTLITFYFLNSLNTYTSATYSIPSGYTSFTGITINEDGTLACVGIYKSGSPTAIVMFELDKENMTFDDYIFTDFSQYFADTYSIAIRKNVLSSASQSSAQTAIAKNIPVYNKETHSFEKFDLLGTNMYGMYIYNGANQQGDYGGVSFATWYDDNTFLVGNSRVANSAVVYKFNFNWNAKTIDGYVSNTIGSGTYRETHIFNGGNIVAVGTMDSNMSKYTSWEIYEFNPASLSFNLVYTYSTQSLGLLIINNKMLVCDTSAHNFLYDVTDFSNPSLLYSLTSSTFRFGMYFYGRRLIGNPTLTNIIGTSTTSGSSATCDKKLTIFEAGESEYIINSTNTNDVQSDRMYGIASASITTGEKANEQLLWSTITVTP